MTEPTTPKFSPNRRIVRTGMSIYDSRRNANAESEKDLKTTSISDPGQVAFYEKFEKAITEANDAGKPTPAMFLFRIISPGEDGAMMKDELKYEILDPDSLQMAKAALDKLRPPAIKRGRPGAKPGEAGAAGDNKEPDVPGSGAAAAGNTEAPADENTSTGTATSPKTSDTPAPEPKGEPEVPAAPSASTAVVNEPESTATATTATATTTKAEAKAEAVNETAAASAPAAKAAVEEAKAATEDKVPAAEAVEKKEVVAKKEADAAAADDISDLF